MKITVSITLNCFYRCVRQTWASSLLITRGATRIPPRTPHGRAEAGAQTSRRPHLPLALPAPRRPLLRNYIPLCRLAIITTCSRHARLMHRQRPVSYRARLSIYS